jgi:hypothetical protein
LIDLPEVTTTRAELNKYTKLVDKHCKSYIAELRSQKKFPRRRIAFKKPKALKKKSKPKCDGEDKTNDGNIKEKRGRKRKFQDEGKESNIREHEENETKVEKTSKAIDKGKKRAVEPEEENEEESCVGPLSSQGEMASIYYKKIIMINDN